MSSLTVIWFLSVLEGEVLFAGYAIGGNSDWLAINDPALGCDLTAEDVFAGHAFFCFLERAKLLAAELE